jgi:opacity protein-like surface antigen
MKLVWMAFVGLLLSSAPIVAQDAGSPSGDAGQGNRKTRTRVIATPHLWAPNIDGDVRIGPLTAPVNVKAGQLAPGIKIGGMGHIQYERADSFVYLEGIGARFGDSEFADFANQNVRSSALLLETGAGMHRDINLGADHVLQVSPYGGVRYVRLSARVDGPQIFLSGDNSWVDPVVGVMTRFRFGERWALAGKLDFAGLGLTGNSYRNVVLGAEYRASSRVSLIGGYRSTQGRFSADEGLAVDLDGNGPIVGLRYVFGDL